MVINNSRHGWPEFHGTVYVYGVLFRSFYRVRFWYSLRCSLRWLKLVQPQYTTVIWCLTLKAFCCRSNYGNSLPTTKALPIIMAVMLEILFGYAGCSAYNLGTGKGTSVLEMVAAFEKAAGLVNFLHYLHRTFQIFSAKLVTFYSGGFSCLHTAC